MLAFNKKIIFLRSIKNFNDIIFQFVIININIELKTHFPKMKLVVCGKPFSFSFNTVVWVILI
jgi:hypothetical protein